MINFRLSTFYKRSSLFAILSLLAALLNYALYPALTHILTPSEFGNFTVIVALSNQILAILVAFNVVSIYLVKKYIENEAREKAQVVQKVLIWFFVAATFLVLVFSPLIKSKLKIEEPLSFVLLTLILLTAVPAVMWTGYLQGHKRLDKVGVYSLAGSSFKFILAIILGIIGGTIGALWGVLFGTAIGILILKVSAGVHLPKISSALSPFDKLERNFIKGLLPYVFVSLVVVGSLGFMQNIDIIFAKAFFDQKTAGIYSGISILSNAVYYVSFLLIWIVLPEIDIESKKINKRVLTTAYKLLGLIAVGALVLELIFKDLIASKLLGSSFSGQGEILIYATLFQISMVAITLYAFYLLILRSRRSLLLGLSVVVPCLVVPWFFRATPQRMIISLWLAVLLGFGIYGIINRSMGYFKR